jgi:4-phospho-D-threonate 3-dehydrogenase / 4-phospho-D-erythronate 3-dehydrogenase
MKPIVGITIGDPAGIGPEVIVKALASPRVYESCRPLVIGDVPSMERAVAQLRSPLNVRLVQGVDDARFESGTIDVIQATDQDLREITMGVIDPRCGACAVHAIKRATEMALAGEIHAICTAPLNKDAMNQAGYHYPGHTEMLGEFTGTRDYSMMLTAKKLRVLHVSTHVSLAEAIRRVKKDRILRVIRLADQAARDYLGIESPTVAVAGLNPHAGENRLFGDEDVDEIAPAIAAANAEGLRAVGPIPGDTIFPRAAKGDFDITVAMFHDQGHVAAKMLGFDSGVNTTIGLPIIRTSVDHGTAFDIAGQGRASEESMVEAIEMAAYVATKRLERSQSPEPDTRS